MHATDKKRQFGEKGNKRGEYFDTAIQRGWNIFFSVNNFMSGIVGGLSDIHRETLNVTILTYNREWHAIRNNWCKVYQAGNRQRYKFIPVLICDGVTLHARVSPLISTTSPRITRRHCFPSLRNPGTGKRLAKASAAERVGVPRRVKSCRYS